MVRAGADVLLTGGCSVPPGAAVVEGTGVLPVAGVLVPLSLLLLVAGADVETGCATGSEIGAAIPVGGDVAPADAVPAGVDVAAAGMTVTAGGVGVPEDVFD